MRLIDIVRQRLRSLFSRAAVEQELDEELRYHVDRQTEEYVAAGMSRQDARRAAFLSVTGLEHWKEECRDMRGLNFVEHFWSDLRFVLRQLRKSPAFSVAAVFVLGLGMCAILAIFAFVDAVLLKPLPFHDPNRLVAVYETNPMFAHSNLSYDDYLDWKQRNRVFLTLDIYQQTGYLLTTPAGTQPAAGARVSDGFFRTLGVAPVLGRDFYPGEDLPSAPRAALLSFTAWQQRYGGRPDILGQNVVLNGAPHTIVGVLPSHFYFSPTGRAEFWTAFHASYSCDLRRSCHSLWGVARLREGVSLQAAIQDVKSIAKRLEQEYPASNRDQGADLAPLAQTMTEDVRPILLALLGGAGLLLLIAGVNVAGLLLVRSEHRRREIAVRTALGASSARLISQFATEAVVLSTAGGLLGLFGAHWAIVFLQRLVSENLRARMPFLESLGLNGRVVAGGGIIVLGAALLLSFTPALRIRSSDLRNGLAEASRGSAGTVWRKLGSRLVTLELATAIVLLSGAGLLGKSLYQLLHVSLGIQPDHLVTIEVVAPRTQYGEDAKSVALAQRITHSVESLPGVQGVGIASNGVPMTSNGNTTWFHVAGRPWNGEHNDVPERDVSATYFTTLGATLLRGRYFDERDRAGRPLVAIVNRALASRYFPGESAVGKQIVESGPPPVTIEIVGEVEDIREGPLDAAIPPVLYFPFEQRPDSYFALVVRTSQDERALVPALEEAIHSVDPGVVSRRGMTMTARIQDSQSAYLHRSLAWVTGGFAALALLLGVVGLYGVVAYSVSQRSREIGIRIALGARPASIYRLVVGEATRLVGFGIVIGSACSVGAATLMRGLLFGVRTWDLPTLAGVAAVLGMAAILATLIPARRAASVNPVDSIRVE